MDGKFSQLFYWKRMNKIIYGIVVCTILGCVGQSAFARQLVDKNQPWSVRMVESEMVRNPESWQVDFSTKLKWSYCVGLELGAIWKVYERYGNERFREYVVSYADTVVQENGNIHTYRLSDYNIDQVYSGKCCMLYINIRKIVSTKEL